jgi:predicted nicotinamide N-methyase
LVAAEGIENAHLYETNPTAVGRDAYQIWNVTGQSVLELGAGKSQHLELILLYSLYLALRRNSKISHYMILILAASPGAGLPSITSALANASAVVATDHPLSPALAGTIQLNMDHNLHNRSPIPPAKISIQPHEWGVLDDTFSQQNRGAFTRIIAADCYWMRAQHENLARTMRWFLAPGGHVCVVAAFHTGRAIVADFFKTALENGLRIESIFERDLTARHEDGREIRREWLPRRDDDGPETRAKWCAICVLKREEE